MCSCPCTGRGHRSADAADLSACSHGAPLRAGRRGERDHHGDGRQRKELGRSLRAVYESGSGGKSFAETQRADGTQVRPRRPDLDLFWSRGFTSERRPAFASVKLLFSKLIFPAVNSPGRRFVFGLWILPSASDELKGPCSVRPA